MAENPLVSVIIPCYNASSWISMTIDSVMSQTYKNIEIIAIDDASSDNTVEILQRLDVDCLHILENESNQGIPETKNRGIREANGEIIAFLDQDDYWLSKKIERQVNKMVKDDSIGIVYTDMYEITEEGRPIRFKSSREPLANEMFDQLYMGNIPCYNVTKIVRRRCLDDVGMLDTDFYCADDQDFDLRVANHSNWKFGYISEPLVLKRVHEKNASGKHMDLLNDLIKLSHKHKENLHNQNLAEKKLADLYARRAFRQLQNEEYSKAREDIKATIRHNTREMKPYILVPAFLMGHRLRSAYLDLLEDIGNLVINNPHTKKLS